MNQTARRYEVLEDDDGLGLNQGDILVGFPYVHDPGHRNNPDGKITILWREGDGHLLECNRYWYSLRRLRGRVPIEWDDEAKSWRGADSWKRPLSRAKRNRRTGLSTRTK